MLPEQLKNHRIILASGSPRRQQFLKDLGLDFEIRLKPVEEIYPDHLKNGAEVAEFLAVLKADAFSNIQPKEIVITGDTVVCLPFDTENDAPSKQIVLGKPKDKEEASEMLQSLSGKTHEVISSICLKAAKKTTIAHAVTNVTFKQLSGEEIRFYIDNFQPYDKAGAYGIQEWIGQIGVTKIEGSYFNVMGMPTHLLYSMLQLHLDENEK